VIAVDYEVRGGASGAASFLLSFFRVYRGQFTSRAVFRMLRERGDYQPEDISGHSASAVADRWRGTPQRAFLVRPAEACVAAAGVARGAGGSKVEGGWKRAGRMVPWRCPEKRSQALRGRNLTRDIRVDGAPRCIGPRLGRPGRGRFLSVPLDTCRHAFKNPAVVHFSLSPFLTVSGGGAR
jgi:hypothetical protein